MSTRKLFMSTEKDFLKKIKFDKKLQKLSKKLKGKKILFYGAGKMFCAMVENYDMSVFDAGGISDKRFLQQNDETEFMGYKTYSPDKIADLKPDCILVTLKNFAQVIPLLNVFGSDIKILALLEEKPTFKKIPLLNSFGIKKRNKSTNDKKFSLDSYKNAKFWLENNIINNSGVVVTSKKRLIYPEVTGYFIPTLLKFGYKTIAKNFGDYLTLIQNADGSWCEPTGQVSYTFDTGMILKGLLALAENDLDENDKYKNAILSGCDWIMSMQKDDGSISTPDKSQWLLPYGKKVPEAIHIYCLEPLQKAAKIYNQPKYEKCVKNALAYYLAQENLTDFSTLSHFNAYIIEGLIDIGETKRAQRAMDLISLFQKNDGSVPAYSNVNFVCSTGLLQYAICWYKLGETEKGDNAMKYAISLQNKSGGWYGSYGKDANYFPKEEISWAVKYFFDAIYYGQKAKYDKIEWSDMWNCIDEKDERYKILEKEIDLQSFVKILDLGCGKGRYTKNLIKKYPQKEFFCVDITDKTLKDVDFAKETKTGTILDIPYSDNYFDVVFCAESLEHCIDLDNAVSEISRVIKKDGKIIIIDKDIDLQGKLQLADFEQWFDKMELKKILEKNNFTVEIKENVKYGEDNKDDGLFNIWVGIKKEDTKKETGIFKIKQDTSSQVEFYLIDAFEIYHFLPLYNVLCKNGIKSGFVAEPPQTNTAGKWFDYDTAVKILEENNMEYSTKANPNAKIAFTTQKADTLRKYKNKKVNLSYGFGFTKNYFINSEDACKDFDLKLVHGQYTEKLAQNYLPPESILVAGYPKYNEFFAQKYTKEQIINELNIKTQKPILVYYPTWDEDSSIQKFSGQIKKLKNKYFVVSKPHHCTFRLKEKQNDLKTLYKISDIVLDGNYDFAKSTLLADIAVCDAKSGSSCEVPYLNPNAHIVLLKANTTGNNFISLLDDFAYVVDNPDKLAEVINEVQKEDKFTQKRQTILESVFSKSEKTEKNFVEKIKKMLN